jgi:hypothetical protein
VSALKKPAAGAAARHPAATPAPSAEGRVVGAVGGDGALTAASPARVLQDALSARMVPRTHYKWSPRKTMLFVMGTCGAFWAVVGVGAAELLRR